MKAEDFILLLFQQSKPLDKQAHTSAYFSGRSLGHAQVSRILDLLMPGEAGCPYDIMLRLC